MDFGVAALCRIAQGKAAREKAKVRLEGKEYIVEDGRRYSVSPFGGKRRRGHRKAILHTKNVRIGRDFG